MVKGSATDSLRWVFLPKMLMRRAYSSFVPLRTLVNELSAIICLLISVHSFR